MNLDGSGSLMDMSNETHVPEIVETDEVTAAVVAGVVPMAELPAFFDRAFNAIAHAVADQGRTITGPAYARYHGPPAETADLEVGFPIDAPVEATGDVMAGALPSGTVARSVHAGSYDTLGESWDRLAAWIGDQGHTPGTEIWEVYLTEPTPEMNPADLLTQLNWTLG